MQRRSLLLSSLSLGLAGSLGLFGPLLRQALAAQPITLTEADRQVLSKVDDYLNGITTVQARFVQSASNGAYSEGDLYVQRPSKMRFEYDPPTPLLIVADGYTLALYDTQLKQVTQVPTWDTPLWFLFKNEIKLADNLELTYLKHGGGAITMTIQEEQAEGNLSSVTLTFSEAPIQLSKWQVVDAQGLTVETGLINPQYGMKLDPKLFDLKELDVYRFQHNR